MSLIKRIYICAHQDDDLIFMNPQIMEDIAEGKVVWTIYLTAGDAGISDQSYWKNREKGVRSAYSEMGVSGWRIEPLTISGKKLISSLSSEDKVRLVFIRLPDGGCIDAKSISNNIKAMIAKISNKHYPSRSLERLWNGQSIITVDEVNKYTRQELIEVIINMIQLSDANIVFTHDPYWINGCDHMDHFYTGLFATEAAKKLGKSIKYFEGYNCDLQPINLGDETYNKKKRIFEVYAAYDSQLPKPVDEVTDNWLRRSYLRLADQSSS